MKNYYKILCISQNASPGQIKRAYLSMVKEYHPDRNPKDPLLNDWMVLFNEAYEVLSNPAKKLSYDRMLASHASEINSSGSYSSSYSSSSYGSNSEPYESRDFSDYKERFACSDRIDELLRMRERARKEIDRKTCLRAAKACLIIGVFIVVHYMMELQHISNAVNWPTAAAKITSTSVGLVAGDRPFGSSGADAVYCYKYSVNGTEYFSCENLGLHPSVSEAKQNMKAFLESLKDRGLRIHFDPTDHSRSIADIDRAASEPSSYTTWWPFIMMAFAFGIAFYLYTDIYSEAISQWLSGKIGTLLGRTSRNN